MAEEKQTQNKPQEQDINQLKKVRREKLAALQEAGERIRKTRTERFLPFAERYLHDRIPR